jgi:hypothetical protein
LTGLRQATRKRATEETMQTSGNFAQRLMWVIWPAFLVAGTGTAIFFTMIDPSDLTQACCAPGDVASR